MQEYIPIDIPGKILYKKEFNVSIRRITPIEQKYIMSLSQKQQRTNQDYINFLKNLVQFDNQDMTFEELYWFDVQYMLYRIRFTTYAKYPIKLKYLCDNEECQEEFSAELDMGNIVTFEATDIENLTTTIQLDNLGECPIRQKVMGDDIVIDKLLADKGFENGDLAMRTLALDLCLISNGRSLDEMWELANDGTVTANDILNIEGWFSHTIWGVKEEIKVKCPKCGKESSRGYILALEDFFSAN